MGETLLAMVADAVARLGAASLDDVVPLFPAFSRDQIHDALWGARRAGRVEALTRGNKHKPGLWGPADNPGQGSFRRKPGRPPLIASVFDLASPRATWPVMQPGTKYGPLGPWDAA